MWEKIYMYTKRIAEHHFIETSPPLVSVRRRQPPRHLSSSVVFETTGSRQTVTNA